MRSFFIYFISIMLPIYCAINFYIGIRGWQAISSLLPMINSKIYWVIFWIISLSYILGRLLRSYLPYWTGNGLTLVGSYWLGIMVYALFFVIFIDIIRFFDKYIGFIPKNIKENPNIVQILGATVILIITGLFIWGIWNAKNPKVVHYDINIPKTSAGLNNLHIVALSDIHLGFTIGEERISQAVNMINGLNPDMVLFVGDTVDEDINILKEKNMKEIFNKIKSKFGSFAVLGNHEHIGGQTNQEIHDIEAAGIKILKDDYIKINDSFYLIGRNDASGERFTGGARKNLDQIMKDVDTKLPVILMDHQPSGLEESQANGVDLQLSGHTHRGQIWPFSYITGRIFEVDWGYLKKGSLQVIVSSGFGTWGPPLRIGTCSEIVDITVNFK